MPNKFFDNVKEKVALARDKTVDAIKNGSDQVAVQASRAKHEYDLKRFRPIWAEDLKNENYALPAIINITEDDPRCEQDACKGAVAFDDSTKEKKALTVLDEYAGELGVEFYPVKHEIVYFADQFNPNKYIDVNSYFGYLKEAKVNELNEIAQTLGASYIKITLKAEKKMFVKKKAAGKVGIKPIANVDVKHEVDQKNLESLEVASEATFKGHEPHEPQLNYFKNDQNIKSLINMRMDPHNKFLGNTYMIKYSNSTGLGEKEAIKIDGVLKKLKIGGNTSFQKEVQEENRYYFQYEIKFPDVEEGK